MLSFVQLQVPVRVRVIHSYDVFGGKQGLFDFLIECGTRAGLTGTVQNVGPTYVYPLPRDERLIIPSSSILSIVAIVIRHHSSFINSFNKASDIVIDIPNSVESSFVEGSV